MVSPYEASYDIQEVCLLCHFICPLEQYSQQDLYSSDTIVLQESLKDLALLLEELDQDVVCLQQWDSFVFLIVVALCPEQGHFISTL